MTAPSIDEYMGDLLGGEDSMLGAMREKAGAEGIPGIQVPVELGRLLQVMILASQSRRILELGTLFGYSSILMARALPSDGHITTLEASSKHAQVARDNFEKAGVAGRITVREGRALDLLPSFAGQSFDLVFIDADKAGYPHYLDWALKLSHPGTVIIADNVWRGGGVAAPNMDDADDAGMVRFNREVFDNPRLTTTVVPRLTGNDAATVSVVS